LGFIRNGGIQTTISTIAINQKIMEVATKQATNLVTAIRSELHYYESPEPKNGIELKNKTTSLGKKRLGANLQTQT
jgi:hypothetical protein